MKKIIVVTHPHFFPEEAAVIARLFDEGLERLHIRKPESSQEELELLLGHISKVYYPRIVLHDHFELIQGHRYATLGGLHLNRRNPTAPEGYSGILSRSCHSLEELQEDRTCLYRFLSPIFRSLTKEGYESNFTLDELRQATLSGWINSRVGALGGIDTTTIPLLRDLPFGGVAVLGAVWGKTPEKEQPDTFIKRFKQLKQCLLHTAYPEMID